MEELLRINHWTFFDVDCLLNPKKGYTVNRDLLNWMKPSRSLSLSSPTENLYFTTINEIKIDYHNGRVAMNCKSWNQGESSYSKLLTEFDLRELFNNNTRPAVFSLESADPNMDYYPFNKIFFAPSALYGSQLLHTMFLSDYLLKFLTVGKEVQGAYPYAMRTKDEFIKPLPEYLQTLELR